MLDEERDVSEFPLVSTVRDDAGTYRCQYEAVGSQETSELSDPAELVLTDRSLPPPGIALSSEGRVGTGSNVTIRCWNKPHGAAFLLHKDGHSAPVQRQDPDVGGTAAFTLFGVTTADGGTYRCSYRLWGHPFLSSPLGDNVTLEVTPTPAPPSGSQSHSGAPTATDGWDTQTTPTPTEERSRAHLGTALLRGFVAALVFGLGVFFILTARSLWRRGDGSRAEEGVPHPPNPTRPHSVPSDPL
ncbi:hypothetical protein ASZ78_000191 [Callipepla squamata]|uniref:Immunoglobulin-like beta-sandwich domain-containing protein n=1 Tax=Callipepla squamata TaxID=9009 RepID=A0A226MBU2_CALSU|nr:hypothetical protein ASZ78_000191 [Callipepla squamata]